MRVARIYLGDWAGSYRPTTLDEVPPFAWSIEVAWLTAALCKGTQAEVRSARYETVSNGTTCRGRLFLEYDGPAETVASLPEAVFVKSTSTLATRLHVGAIGGTTGEVRFYRDIEPTTSLPAPRGFFGIADRRTGRSILMIQDLARVPGLEFGDCRNPLDKRQAEGLVDSLGDVHGALIESSRFAEDLRWIRTTLQVQEILNKFVGWERRTEVGVKRSSDVLPEPVRRPGADLHAQFMRSLALDETGARGLVHSDVHAGNWYRLPAGGMGLFDWSAYSRGRGTRDLGYALSSSLTIEDRRAWERELVARYADRVATVSGIAQDVDEVFLSYRRQLLHGLTFWLTTIGRSAVQPQMQTDEVSLLNISRIAQAVVDNETLTALRDA